MIAVTLLGTGSPMPDPHRAGPATLVQANGANLLVDAGRAVVMRLMAAGVPPAALSAVLLTHLHSDHLTDLSDLITTQWITTFEPTPLQVFGPVGTARVVHHLLEALGPDICYRMDHHDDLTRPPLVQVTEVDIAPGTATTSTIAVAGVDLTITAAATDHRPVDVSLGYRIGVPGGDAAAGVSGVSVVLAGDTVPCVGLDALAAGADALVHTAIRKDIIAEIPIPRLHDTLDYHSSPEQAGESAARAGVGTLILTHYVPAIPIGDAGVETAEAWRALAATRFAGRIEIGDDLHRVEIVGASDTRPDTRPESEHR
jgi:ribonuclease Z